MIRKTFDLIKRHKLHFALFLVLFFVGVECDCLFSQEPIPIGPNTPPPEISAGGQSQPSIVQELAAITILSLLPYAIMLLTSYIKIVIVLSLLRNALGVQQSPPNQIITGIALFMSVYVMFPTCLAMYQAAEEFIHNEPPQELFSAQSADYIVQIVGITKEPLKSFLIRNTSNKHISGFYQLAYRSFPDPYKKSLSPTDFIVIIPSFITTQLKAAFEVGVLIYLPFFVIDLVTANILLAMGMMMLSPLTIALPLKLLLIVMVDGWTLIIQGLVLSFK